MPTDFRMALRRLRRRPLFAISVVLTLAIGLGANATIFSVVDSVLLRSLPYEDPDGLVAAWATVQRDPGQPESVERRGFSVPDLEDLANESSSLERVAAYSNGSFRLGGVDGASPERLVGTIADVEYLRVLGVEPLLGDFASAGEEEGVPGVLLAHSLWQRRFAGDPKALGEIFQLDGESAQVVGVLPAGFRGLVDASELLFPLSALPERLRQDRGARWLDAVGRLQDGATLDGLRAEMRTQFQALETEYASSNQGYGADAGPLAAELVGAVRSPLLLLWAAVLAVLVIASVNVINLLIVNLRQRAGDVGIRRALGASNWSLARGFLAESVVLAALGSLVGLLFAVLLLRWLQPLAPVDLPGLFTVDLGLRALGFVVLLTVLVGLLVGGVAGVRSLAGPAQLTGGDSRSTQRDRLGAGLLIAEVALATLLTIAAGLMVRSFLTMSDVDPGMVREDVGFLRLDWSEGREDAELPVTRDALLDKVRAVPGVELAALARETPFGGQSSATVLSPEGLGADPDLPYSGAVRVYYHRVTPDYFEALEIPLLRGRTFERADVLPFDDESSGSEAPGVAVLSAALAERAFAGTDPIGQRFYLGPPTVGDAAQQRPWFEVVGVVADHRHRDLIPDPTAPQDPDVFFAMRQFNPSAAELVVRSALPTETLIAQIDQELRAEDPSLLTFAPATLAGRLAEETARPRFSGLLMTGFAALALALAAVGIYGVVANQVLQRRREIGVRMALGADGGRVLRDVALPAVVKLATGLLLGLVGALAVGRWIEAELFEVSVRDPAVFLGSVILLGFVALLAVLVPARRASGLDPVTALRSD